MLMYEFVRETNGERVFAYYPEGNRNAPGTVVVETIGIGHVVEASSEDFGNRYAFHAIKNIDPTKKSGTVAWY